MTRSMLTRAAALATLLAAGALAAPAQASLPDHRAVGTIAGGSFAGVRLGPKGDTAGETRRNPDVAGDGQTCMEFVAEQPARNGGEPELRRVRICR